VPTLAGDCADLDTASALVVPTHVARVTFGGLGNAVSARVGNGNEITTLTHFPGNIIPADRIDPTAKVMTNYWARANGPGAAFTNVNNYTANASVGGDNDQFNARLDHNLSDRHRVFARYTYWTNTNLPIDPYQT